MELNEYQKLADRTSGDLTPWNKVRNGCYGLNGEAGECIDILKKVEFKTYIRRSPDDELGDVMCILLRLLPGWHTLKWFTSEHNKLRRRYPGL
jgi:NTP pyrophosphatase (non-canonical NTP hydrolase)